MKSRARQLFRIMLAAIVLFTLGGCVYDPYYTRSGVVYDDDSGRTYSRTYYDDYYSPGYYYSPAYSPYYGYGYSPWYPWGVGLGFTYYGGGHHRYGGHHWSGGHHSGGSHHHRGH
jgi:hypothetical protein